MIDKKFVKRIVIDLFKKDQSLKDHYLMHPEREWFLGFGTALVILIAGVYWSLHIYQVYNSTDIGNEESPTGSQMVYREKEVELALEELAKRKEKYELIKQELASYSAPSAFIPTDLLDSTGNPGETATTTAPASSTSETEDEETPLPEDEPVLQQSL